MRWFPTRWSRRHVQRNLVTLAIVIGVTLLAGFAQVQ